ncbi:MAG: hypothetical protein KIT34_10080 [Cyanobacteria bacterium TGS_CYA1]|nr:hypothetical protein [Cyanobacteria bacterium TGS_CYA1]
MSESDPPENVYKHYRLCFWIGFICLGICAAPIYVGWSFRPKPIIQMAIGTVIYFVIGGTIGGLSTLVVGFPLNLLCDTTKWSREQRRWFLAFTVPFVTFALYIALFTRRGEWFDPIKYLFSIGFPIALTLCVLVFGLDKIALKAKPFPNLFKAKKLLIAGALFFSISIPICYFGPMNRGTPQLYDYATEIVDSSRMSTSNGKPCMYQMVSFWFLTGKTHLLDGKPVDIPEFKTIEDPIYASLAPVQIPDGRLLQIQKSQIYLFDSAGKNGVPGPRLLKEREFTQEVLLNDGQVLIIGGIAGEHPSNDIEIFDYKTMRLTLYGKLKIPRYSFEALKLRNGNVIVIGGITSHKVSDAGDNLTSTIELIDINTKQVKIIGQLQKARTNALAYSYDFDKAVIFGGNFKDEAHDQNFLNGTTVSEIELYNGKSTESGKRMYPPQAWLWSLIDTLRSLSRNE